MLNTNTYFPSTSDEANIDHIFEDPASHFSIYLSSQTAAYNKNLLDIYDIKYVLTVAKHMNDSPFPESFEYKIIEIDDLPSEDLHIQQGIDFMEKSLKKGNLLVHCANGISRSPSMVCAYLIHKLCINSNEALDMVKAKRHVNPNFGFLKQLESFHN